MIQVPLFAFITAAVSPVVRMVMSALGVGLLNYSVFSTLFDSLIATARSAYGSTPAFFLQIANIAGIGEALGYIVSAILIRAVLMALPKFGVLPS